MYIYKYLYFYLDILDLEDIFVINIYIYIFYLKIVFMKITFFIEIVIRNRPNKWALMINCYILSLL